MKKLTLALALIALFALTFVVVEPSMAYHGMRIGSVSNQVVKKTTMTGRFDNVRFTITVDVTKDRAATVYVTATKGKFASNSSLLALLNTTGNYTGPLNIDGITYKVNCDNTGTQVTCAADK